MTITKAEAEFFGNLTVFQFDAAGLFQDCPPSQQKVVHKLRFCLSDVYVDAVKVDTRVVNNSTNSSSGNWSIVDNAHSSKQDTHGGGQSSTSLAIITVIIICVTLVLLTGIVLVYRMKTASLRDSASEGSRSSSAADTYPSTGATTITNPHNSSSNRAHHGVVLASVWENVDLLAVQVDVDAIHDIQQLSEDSSSTSSEVWLVRYQAVRLLTSKRLKKIANTNIQTEKQAHRKRVRALIGEIKLAAQLKNPKIVHFVGAAWTIEADLQVLYEFMDGGDLRTYLGDERSPRAWSLQKIQIAIDVAEALVYCHHSFSPPLVHGDLRSRNVLLSMNGEAKLKNVGVARFRSSSQRGAIGSARWLAPEVITGENSSDYGSAADIFSLGVVLCELDTHKVPYEADVRA